MQPVLILPLEFRAKHVLKIAALHRLILVAGFFFLGQVASDAQTNSVSLPTDSTAFPVNARQDSIPMKINVPRYFALLGTSIGREFTAPFHLKKKDWIDLGKFAVVMGVLTFADEPVQQFALRVRNNNPGIIRFGHAITDFGDRYEAYTLAALMAYGSLVKNQKLKTTTLLASQSAIVGGLTGTLLKYVSWRQRPNYYGTQAIEAEPIFHGPFPGPGVEGNRMNSSFPSGHTTAAFAAATVFAEQYRDRALVPILAYTAASMIGLSRITENKHWATDVLAGAALGYVTGKQVIRNYHRYARARAQRKQKSSVSITLNYRFGVLQPGLVYTFR